MAITTDKIKVGDKFYCPNVLNEHCDNFGLLTCTKVEVKEDKFCTNPVELGCYAVKEHYIKRNTLVVHYVNQHGKKGVLRYWEDEFKPNFANSQEEVVDKLCKDRLSYCYAHLRIAIRREYGDIFSLTNKISNPADKIQAKKIVNLLDNLRTELIEVEK